jgi:hypothetical protein
LLGNAHGFGWVPWAAAELASVGRAWAVKLWVVVPAEFTATVSLGAASVVGKTNIGNAIQVRVGVKADRA